MSVRPLIVLVLLAEPSNAFLVAASWPPHRPVPATLWPTMGLNNWLKERSETFWKSSDTSVTATGGGDAGVAGLTKVANSVRMVTASSVFPPRACKFVLKIPGAFPFVPQVV
eukprot:scaffold76925_cov63-Phaeocystis_antarctica.AAC.1